LLSIGVEAAHALDLALGSDFGAGAEERAPTHAFETRPIGPAPAVVPPIAHTAYGADSRDADELARRVALALDRHRQDGTRYALHRVTLNASTEQAEAVAAALPPLLRATDFLCRAEGATWVLLCLGPAPRDVLGRRVRRAWRRTHGSVPAPIARVESVALARRADAAAFAAAARDWRDDVAAWTPGVGLGDTGTRTR
jgi:hypothetical protein